MSLIDPVISLTSNERLVREISYGEVKLAAFQLGPLKAPGSDGFPGLFFQSYWDVVCDEVFKAVSQFFNEAVLLKEMNQTNVTLIPKVNSLEATHQ